MGFEAAAAAVGEIFAGTAADAVVGSVVGDAVAGGVADAVAGGVADAALGGLGDAALTGAGEAAFGGLSSADAAALYGASGYGEAAAGLSSAQTAAASAAGWTPSQIASALKTGGSALSALTNVVGAVGKYNAAGKASGISAAAAQAAAKLQSDAALNAAGTQSAAALKSGNDLSQSAKDAASQEAGALGGAITTAQNTLTQQVAAQKPYLDAGTSALTTLNAGLQPGGQYNRAFTMADAQNMPAYQFALQQGTDAIRNASAAGGLSLSTADIQSQGKFAENTAAQFQQQAFNQWLSQNNLSLGTLQNMVATGQVSTNQLQNALAQAGVNTETLQKNIGETEAAGTVGSAKALASGQTTAAGYQAAGTVNSANALAGGIVGSGNANAAGTVSQANTLGSGLTTLGNYLTTPSGVSVPGTDATTVSMGSNNLGTPAPVGSSPLDSAANYLSTAFSPPAGSLPIEDPKYYNPNGAISGTLAGGGVNKYTLGDSENSLMLGQQNA